MIKKWIDNLLGSDLNANEGKDKSYLIELFDTLARIKAEDKWVNFSIQSMKKMGFSVKVGGLYAFIDFQDMPWLYRDIQKWKFISPYIIDTIFKAKIKEMSYEEKIYISIDASGARLETPVLELNEGYRCIVLQKTDTNMLVEIGNNFNWQCGSIEVLINKSTFFFQEEFNDLKEGDLFPTRFHGFDKEGRIMLGHQWIDKEWRTGELDQLIGTIQSIKIQRDAKKNLSFLYLDKYKCQLDTDAEEYGSEKNLELIEKYLKRLPDGHEILCNVINIVKGKYRIVIKLSEGLYKEICRVSDDKRRTPNRPIAKVAEDVDEINKYIGTMQQLDVRINENGVREYWLLDKYICLPQEIYKKVKKKNEIKGKLKKYINSLENNAKVWFEIIARKGRTNKLLISQNIETAEKNLNISLAQPTLLGEKLRSKIDKLIGTDIPDEIDKYIGTVQELDVRINEDGKREYWFLDQYICLPNDPYKNTKQSKEINKRLKKHINSLEHNAKVWFEIIVRKGRTNKLFIRQNLLSVEKNLSLSPIELLPLDNSIESKSNKIYLTELIPDELEEMIDTEQTITIKKDEYGSKTYWYDDQYQCIPQRFFENYLDNVKYINQIRRYINSLDSGSQIQCLITDINYKKNKISIALSPIYKNQDIKELVAAQEKQRLLHTEQTITIEYDHLEQPIFFLKNQFKCRFPLSAIEYRQNKGRIKKYIELYSPREMECLVQGINTETNEPILRLTLRQQRIIHKELRLE